MTRPGRLGLGVVGIGKIVDAIEARDVDAARIASEAHMAAAAEFALIRLREFPQD